MTRQRLVNFYCKFLFFIALIKARLSGKRTPLMANLIITDRCNLKCFYCYVDTFNREVRDIEDKALYELIDTMYKRGTRLIILLGGEPLLHKEIGDLIRYIKKKKMVCELITNGYFVDRHIDELSLCDSVCVSLDGDEESHDHNRGKGSHKKAIEAICLLKEKGIATRIKAVLTKNNEQSLNFLCRFAKKNGLMLTVSTAATYDERNYKQKDRWLNNKKKSNFFNRLYSLKKEGYPIGYSFSALNYIKKWPYNEDYIINHDRSNHIKKYKLLRCRRKDNSFYIDSDGYMYPCAYQWGVKTGENVFSDGFDAVWANMVNYDCYSCGSLPDIDISLMFNCNLENILKAIKFYSRKK